MPKTPKTTDKTSHPDLDTEKDTNTRAAPSGDASTSDQDESIYGHYNSGRRAAGHGGGSLDDIDEFAGERNEAGYAYSGGGEGHTPMRSRQREADEELESRTGPYERSGRPAAEDSSRNNTESEKKTDKKAENTRQDKPTMKHGKPL